MQKRVLLVDDESAILMAFKKLLQSPSIYIDTAETIEEVEAFIQEYSYDAVIADLRLTGIHGEEGLEIIRRVKERSPETHVILITGYGNPNIMEKTYTLGASLYLEKPVSSLVLRNALRDLGVQ